MNTSLAVNRRGRLGVLISRSTFSAAENFITDLERRTRAVFVGETSGGARTPGATCTRLREGERAQQESIILPLFYQMTEADQVRVVESLCAGISSGEAAAPRR